MNFSFLNPYFLWFSPLISVPIIIHFLFKKKKEIVRFSETAFINWINKQIIRRFKLRQILLLILRVLILVLLTLTFARPLLYMVPIFNRFKKEMTAKVLILDNSYSMGYVERGKTRFSKAIEVSRQIIEMMQVGDEMAIIVMSKKTPSVISHLTGDVTELFKKLNKVNLSFHSTDLFSALFNAYDILERSNLPNKQIIVISDMANHIWCKDFKKNMNDFHPQAGLIFVDVAGESSSNLAVDEVKVKKGEISELSEIEVEIRNYSSKKDVEVLTNVSIENRNVLQGFVNLDKKKGKLYKNFFYRFSKSGNFPAKVRINPKDLSVDRLLLDNEYFFQVKVRDKIKVLCVEGNPTFSPFLNDTFYVRQALMPKEGSKISVTVVGAQELNDISFEPFSVIVLSNVGKLMSEQTSKLFGYVKKGGGLIFFLGENVEIDEYNNNLGNLLPGKLQGIIGGNGKYQTISFQDLNHPILKIFAQPGQGDLNLAKFYYYFNVEPKEVSNCLLKFSDGNPCLVEGSIPYDGAGKIFLFSSTANRKWTDFPVKPVYLPLIQQMVYYLARNDLLESRKKNIYVGGMIKKTFSSSYIPSFVQIIKPNKKASRIIPIKVGDAYNIEFKDVDLPGIYQLSYFENGRKSEEFFPVNLDLKDEESNLTKISRDRIKENSFLNQAVIIDELKDLEKKLAQVSQGKEITKILILLIFGLFLIEGYLRYSNVLFFRKKQRM